MNNDTAIAPATVALTIPCRAEFVGVARLAILGVASRLDFNYDEVEDLRLAVGEACAAAIDRAVHTGQTDTSIHIECNIQNDALTVEVQDNVTGPNCAHETPGEDIATDPENIGALLMEILVDAVQTETDAESGTTVRLTKRIEPT